MYVDKDAYLSGIGRIQAGKNFKERQTASASILRGKEYPVVATAAHCVYSLKKKEFYNNVFFRPVLLNRKKYRAIAVAVPMNFIEHGYLEYDSAFLIMDDSFSKSDEIKDVAIEAEFNLAKKLSYTIWGYSKSSRKLTKSSGEAMEDIYKKSSLQGITCTELDGMSGGPWITTHQHRPVQNSISILSYRSVGDVMWGPYWGKIIKSAYLTALNKHEINPDIYLHYF